MSLEGPLAPWAVNKQKQAWQGVPQGLAGQAYMALSSWIIKDNGNQFTEGPVNTAFKTELLKSQVGYESYSDSNGMGLATALYTRHFTQS